MGSQILCSPLTFLKLAARVNQENVDLLIDPDLDDETLRLSPRLYDVFEEQLKGIMSLELD
ncbi:MAG: hypothetical protein HUJ26_19975 [Planctomycetaceae bacterium]|nr:hypothetical protein [Planctomycetaceae bacterium]